MLVPSMTLAEIKKEIDKDFPIVRNKGIYVQRKLLHEYKPKGGETIVKYFDYVSKYKNNWIIRFGLNKKNTFSNHITYYYGDKGLLAIAPVDNGALLTFHTTHFFKRFNERLNLNLTLPKDIIRKFMNENDRYEVHQLEEYSRGVFSIFVAARNGYILGTHDKNLRIIRMNTFITFEMLKCDQRSVADKLNSEMKKYPYDPEKFNG